jgi:hypothetical protein
MVGVGRMVVGHKVVVHIDFLVALSPFVFE